MLQSEDFLKEIFRTATAKPTHRISTDDFISFLTSRACRRRRLVDRRTYRDCMDTYFGRRVRYSLGSSNISGNIIAYR